MALTKGTFVRHPSDEVHKEKLGFGIVVEDEKNASAAIFFEKRGSASNVKTDVINYLVVDAPKEARLFLENALCQSNGDRQPFPQVVERFLTRFKGGLVGAVYLSGERHYKIEAHELASHLLSKESFSTRVAKEEWQELSADIKKVFTINLLSKFELIKLSDALKDEFGQKEVCHCFYELLYAEKSISSRIQKAEKILANYELNTWPVISYLLFIVFPEQYMFVKPTMTKEPAKNRGFDIQYDSQVNGVTYQKVLDFSQDIFNRLIDDPRDELRPRDMIDIQGFMWCTFANGWTDEAIQQFESELAVVT